MIITGLHMVAFFRNMKNFIYQIFLSESRVWWLLNHSVFMVFTALHFATLSSPDSIATVAKEEHVGLH